MRRVPAVLLFGVVIAVAIAGCGSTGHPAPGHSSRHTAGNVGPSQPRPAPDPVAGMTLAQLVGQVFMVGTTAGAAESVSLAAVSQLHVGNVFLSGRSHLGVAATAAVVDQF